LDYALGSSLECAACLDIARIKKLLAKTDANHAKERLSEITRMLVGLRKAWENWKPHEDSPAYRVEPSLETPKLLFHHEALEVYGAGLGLMEWFVSTPGGEDLSNRIYRQMDQNITSILLNIAEANGRYSELDHRRFLDVATTSAVKAAAYLDLAVQKHALLKSQCIPGKDLLERILAMLSRM
jgi:four helix bundle protein